MSTKIARKKKGIKKEDKRSKKIEIHKNIDSPKENNKKHKETSDNVVKREKSSEIASALRQYEADWERRFIDNIHDSRNIPYVSLVQFSLVNIHFIESEFDAEEHDTSKEKRKAAVASRMFKAIFGESISSKRKKKFGDIFNIDDGPSVHDYTSQLGLQFWSQFCKIEKTVLKKSVVKSFWDRTNDSSKNLKELLKEKKGVVRKIWNLLVETVVFLFGVYEPVRAPQKVITPAERFRVQSVMKVKKASEDIIPPKEFKTFKEIIEKRILIFYKLLVDHAFGGKWPRIRTPTLEELYNDILIWVLDIIPAKERIRAILNDRIKKQIL